MKQKFFRIISLISAFAVLIAGLSLTANAGGGGHMF